MRDSSLHAPSREELVGLFCEALETAKDSPSQQSVLKSWCDAHPDSARDFVQMAALLGIVVEAERRSSAQEMPAPTSLPGFADLRLIGVGGMGAVFKAKQIDLDRDVAVKVRLGRPDDDLDRFERERKVLARLHHTHIVPVHLTGEQGEYQYFAMALIEGTTLANVVQTLSAPGMKHGRITTLAGLAKETVESGYPIRHRTAATEATLVPRPSAESASAGPGVVLTLPQEYFESVAKVMADAADAIQHAHDHEVVHRDVKPSNIMVDRRGQSWIIDFGLAYWKGLTDQSNQGNGAVSPKTLARTRGPLGTPSYMAPEQHVGEPEKRSDVWGLGATLYELLTLRQAFPGETLEEIRARITKGDYVPPRRLVANVPLDLDAICRKALCTDAGGRYTTAKEFANDLRRWLHGEPTMVRPRSAPVRVWLWARRNRAWATAIVTAVVMAGALGGYFLQRARAATAEARAETAETRETAAREREKDRQHEALVLALQGERLTTRTNVGWFERVWPKVGEAAKIRGGAELRSQAVATLQGMDAVMRKRWEQYTAYSLAFDAKGQLHMGGWKDAGARLWDGSIHEPAMSKQIGFGPAAFRRDGAALQLAFNEKEPYRFVLWDMTKQTALRTLEIPDTKGKKMPPNTLVPRMALSGDGALAALAVKLPDGKDLLTIWDTETGKLLHRFDVQARSLAFSPPNEKGPEFLAAGHDDGNVTIWSLPKGEKAVTLKVRKTAVTALAFGPDLRRGEGKVEKSGLSRWLLAAGQAGGHLSILGLETLTVRSFCYGSSNDVHAVAFSPDGMTLASAGRAHPKLWDVSTGKLLLNLAHRAYTHAVAFSADGKRLAVSSESIFGHPGGVDIYEILFGHGVQSLRGLVGQVAAVAWSPDGRLMAALAHNWQLAVWDREANKLLHVFEPPPGEFADNAALAFSPDGKQLAFSALRTAILWDLDTGKQVQSWSLPFGFGDQLLYNGPDQLSLFRVETKDPNVRPYGSHRKDFPRICRIRNLFDKEDKGIAREDFNWHVFGAAPSPSQNCFVAEGSRVDGKDRQRSIKAFDAKTGVVRWTVPSRMKADGSFLHLGSDGEFASVDLAEHELYRVIEVSSGRVRVDLDGGFLGPKAAFRLSYVNEFSVGPRLTTLFRIAIDSPDAGGKSFNRAGTHLAWTTTDGVVPVCDLAAVQERLAAVGLGW